MQSVAVDYCFKVLQIVLADHVLVPVPVEGLMPKVLATGVSNVLSASVCKVAAAKNGNFAGER